MKRRTPFARAVAVSMLSGTLMACSAPAARPAAPRSTLTASECVAAPGATRDTPGAVTLTFVAEPAAPADAEATIRIVGEQSQSDMTVPVAGGARLDLARGIYDVRVTVRGYDAAMTRLTITPGCAVEMTAKLGK